MIPEWFTLPLHSVNVDNQPKNIEGNTFSAPVKVNIYTGTNEGGKKDLKDTRIQQWLKKLLMIAFTYS